MQIHVTEEGRPMSFARHNLRTRVPQLSTIRRKRLAISAPLILGAMSKLMMEASPQIAREYGIPSEVVNTAYRDNPIQSRRMREASTKLFGLCADLGLVNWWSLPLWKLMRICPETGT
jgi:hypothetical protein